MRRELYNNLLAWKNSPRRKPLLLSGARQTGKTHLLTEFGEREYEQVHVYNFEQEPLLSGFFERDLRPERILAELALYRGTRVEPERHLLFFDEIQACNGALNSLKYFQEQAGEYHVVAAGSLLGVELSKPGSFPVGKVNMVRLYPMTFLEFLEGIGQGGYREYLEKLDRIEPLPEALHRELIALLRAYYVVGGMPEAVAVFAESRTLDHVRTVQEDILNAFAQDFAKHTPAKDIPKMRQVWESLPVQLARENKRFLFSTASESARARDYEDALLWLEGAGLVTRSFVVETPRLPLKSYSDRQRFKLYALDVGLWGALSRLSPQVLVSGDAVFQEYHGAFVESYVAQTLSAVLPGELYYWRNRKSTAEVDFLCEFEAGIVPLEVKAGVNPRSKSLRTVGATYALRPLLRTTLRNLRVDGDILNVPLYAAPLLPQLAAVAFEAQ